MNDFRCLTISQPYASLIADGAKFVENRTWECFYRGPLLIHAGKGTQYLTKKELANYPHGCIVSACRMIACVHVPSLQQRIHRGMPYRELPISHMQEILAHEHTEGPYGFVLAEVQKLATPVACAGAQGLWIPSLEVVEQVTAQLQWPLVGTF